MKTRRYYIALHFALGFVFFAALIGQSMAQTAAISVGTDSGLPGSKANISIQFDPGSSAVSSLQFDLMYPASISYDSSTEGDILTSADKGLSSSAVEGGRRFVIFGLNTNTINAGLLCNVVFNIASGAQPGTVAISVTNFIASDPDAVSVPVSATPGSVTVNAPADSTPPVISGVASSNVTVSGATISWQTDEDATGQVEYGTTNGYGSVTPVDSTLRTTHTTVLGGLVAATTYHYRVISEDAAGNRTVSGDLTFTTQAAADTTAPVISGVASSNISSSGATISWQTNEDATAQVEYGTTTGYGSVTPVDGTLQKTHTRALEELAAETTYHYRVISEDGAGNRAVSGDLTFTTLAAADTTAPVISGVASSNITVSGATISWQTDEDATGQVEYGTTIGYGSVTPVDGTLQKTHTRALEGLAAGTAYHYRVISEDEAGNRAVSRDRTFTTLMPADTTAPVISGVASSNITISGATISWQTNEGATGQVEFGRTTEYGSVTAVDSTLGTTHTRTLEDLVIGTTYHYRVISVDGAGNRAESNDYTFATLPDTTPPTISLISVSGQTGTEATITWKTDEASDSQVEFGPSMAYENATEPVATMQTDHSVALQGLIMGMLYHFRVVSSDEAGNVAVSEDHTFTATPPASTLAVPLFNRGQFGENVTPYAGITIANMGENPATLVFTAFDEEGNRVTGQGIANPSTYQLNPGAQLSLVDIQIFGDSFPEYQSKGWIKVESSTDRIRGFFLAFDGQTRQMDGVGFASDPLTHFVFTEIGANQRNRIHIVNNNRENARVTIDLIGDDGQKRGSLTETINGYGSMAANLYTDLFSGKVPDSGDYIKVSADRGVEAFLLTQRGTADISLIQAQDTDSMSPVLYSAQYTSNGTYRTSLSVVNLDSVTGSVRFQLFGKDGIQIGETEDMSIAPNGKLHIDDPEFFLTEALVEQQVASVLEDAASRIAGVLFGDGDQREYAASSSVLDGYVRIEGSGVRLLGSTTIKGRDLEGFAAAFTLVSELRQSLVFNHVASDETYFTGISLANPGSTDATVNLGLYSSEGNYVSGLTLAIPAKGQRSSLLTDVFPVLREMNMVNGYVRISSTVPVAAYSMFGTHTLSVLSAIPGQTEE